MQFLVKAAVVFFIFVAVVYAEPYQFPEMDTGDSHDHRLQSIQIPLSILKEMSTEDLAETCMNFPFNFHVLLFNTNKQGINSLLRDFNGYRELITRPDGPSILLDLYQKMNPAEYNDDEPSTPGEFKIYEGKRVKPKKWRSLNFLIVESMLDEEKVFRRLMKAEKKKLAKETLLKLDQKNSCSEENTVGCDKGRSAQLGLRFLNFDKKQKRKVLDMRQQEDEEWLKKEVRKYINE